MINQKIQAVIKKHPDKANTSQYLELAKKDEKGVPRPTGTHRVKLLRGDFTKRTTQHKGEQQGVMLIFDEDGVEKKYFVPMLNDEGSFHYLFEKFANIEEGTELEMEFVKEGMRGYIDVRPIRDTDDIPVIESQSDTYEPDFDKYETN